MPQGRVICPACGKQYRFNTQLAGRKVKCKGCQSVIRMPISPDDDAELLGPGPQIAASQNASGYELDLKEPPEPPEPPASAAAAATPSAAGGNCPDCNAPLKAAAVICINCGFNIKAGKKIKTAVNDDALPDHPPRNTDAGDTSKLDLQTNRVAQRKARQEELAADVERKYKVQNIYAPLILTGVGVILVLLNALVLAPWAQSMPQSTPGTGYPIGLIIYTLVATAVLVAIQIPLLLFGILVVSRLYGASFGTLTTALLKLIALAVMIDGVNDCVNSGMGIITGGLGLGIYSWVVRGAIVYAVFHGLCASLFEMELGEILVLFILMIFVPIALMIVIGGLLFNLFMV